MGVHCCHQLPPVFARAHRRSDDAELTRSGVTVGTPQYISPEQAQGPKDVDIRTDIYSLGATLYHMITGLPPFTAGNAMEMVTHGRHDPCVGIRATPIAEAMLAIVLLDHVLRHRAQNMDVECETPVLPAAAPDRDDP